MRSRVIAGAFTALVMAVPATAGADPVFDRALGMLPPPAGPVPGEAIVMQFTRPELLYRLADAAPGDLDALQRVIAWPSGFDRVALSADRWPELTGLSFEAIGWIALSGAPPAMVTILGGSGSDPVAEAAAMAAALEPRGFAPQQEGEVAFWWRGEDFSISLSEREPDDPFGGALGQAARLGLVNGALIHAAGWEPALAAAAAVSGGPSLAGDPLVAALAAALTAGEDGTAVMQAMMIGAPSLDPFQILTDPETGAPRDPAAAAAVIEAAVGEDALPPYFAAALAETLTPAGELRLVVALAYPDRATAETARSLLKERTPLTMPEDSLTGARATVLEPESAGVFVARLDAAVVEGTRPDDPNAWLLHRLVNEVQARRPGLLSILPPG